LRQIGRVLAGDAIDRVVDGHLTAEQLARPAIEFFSFTTGTVTEVAVLEKPFKPWTNPEGLSVSADGRWILYTQEDRADMDIMLVGNFR
jgi:hypothetical protein